MTVQLESPGRRSRARRRRRERHARRRAFIAVALSLAVLLGLLWGLYTVGQKVLSFGGDKGSDDYTGQGTGQVVVVIEPGDGASAIGRRLQKAGVVKSVTAFVEAAQVRSAEAAKIQAGSYKLPKQLPAATALDLLLDPASRAAQRVTIPEGLRLDETLKALEKRTGISLAEYQKALRNPKAIGLPAYAKGNAEGFLFPATYDITPDLTATSMLKAMTARFAAAAEKTGVSEAERPYEAIIIASLVEAEARHAEDFGKVARVVYNRLESRGNKKLQFDSTVNYLLKADKKILTVKDLDIDSPYNTRKYEGLPPGPIGSPGEAAMIAAVDPPAGDWEYFVTVNEAGETRFTGDYDQFLRWKAEAKRNGVA